MRHALDCGMCCGLQVCDCGAGQQREHYRLIQWADMPFTVRKAWLRMCKAFPGYDLSLTRGWEWFQAVKDPGHIYATNRSGDWYVADSVR